MHVARLTGNPPSAFRHVLPPSSLANTPFPPAMS
jgi:hypothetical protein